MDHFRDLFYDFGISQIVYLQTNFQNYNIFLMLISRILHPISILLYILPLITAINPALFVKVLISCILSQYSNIILKWVMAQDRPFWWVHETDFYEKNNYPRLIQNKLTCETSAGAPSGHVMCIGAILSVLCIWIVDRFAESKHKKIVDYVTWSSYLFTLFLLSISRMFVGAHFMHQCLIGLFLGHSIGRISSKGEIFNYLNSASKLNILKVIGGMVVLAVGIYWGQKFLDIDPQWTVKLAFKWCEDPSYPTPESVPTYSLNRDLGCSIGLLLASPLKNKWNIKMKLKYSIPATILVILFMKFLLINIPKHQGILIFYLYTNLAYIGFIYMLLNVIPQFCGEKLKES